MYGASTQLVITMKGGTVNGFTMVGSFLNSRIYELE